MGDRRVARGLRVVMALENNPYPQDVRVRNEAEALVAGGHQVLVLAPRGAGQRSRETVSGVRVLRYRSRAGVGPLGIVLEYAIAVVQLTLRTGLELARGADVVHLHNPPDLLFAVGWLARRMGRVVVFDHHDLAPELFEQKFGAGAATAILRWCERMTMRVADVVIAANASHRQVAIERGRVDPARVFVVRNGPREATIAEHVRASGGVLSHPRLCYVGSLGSQDGVAVLPELLETLRGSGSQASLTVAGDGPELARLEALARRHGVLEHIEFLGHIAHERVPEVIEQADICLDVAPCTPLNHRSTMIKIGEYMAGGRPIVSFALRETRNTAGDCALYAERDDATSLSQQIVRLCEDGQLRASLSRHALARVREMTWERSAEHLRAAYGVAAELRAHRAGERLQALGAPA